MFSNRYIFIYASVMVSVVAVILTSAATLLKPMQERNEKIEKMSGILAAANVTGEKAVVLENYNTFIKEEWVIDVDGNVVSKYHDGNFKKGDIRAFDLDMKVELANYSKYQAGKKSVVPHFPIYIFSKDADTLFIVPLRGKGLWGPIWGNLALKDDFRTVVGATFSHKSETPGLGAEIATREFQQQFAGKTIFNEQYEFTSIEVVKGGVANSNINPEHGVDAISGGTITSNGVTQMLKDVLSIYEPFVKKQIL